MPVRKERSFTKTLIPALGALSLLAAPGAHPAFAQHPMEATRAPIRIENRSPDGRVTIPFRLEMNHVVIPVAVQGTKIDMVLDTGMPMDGVMLYHTPRIDGLKLDYVEGAQVRVAGAGGNGGPMAADLARGLTVDVGDLHVSDVTAIVSPPIETFTAYHEGVIGATLFRNFVVAIDFDAGLITLSDPKTYAPAKDAASVPLTLQHNIPRAEVTVLGPGGKRLPAKVVVDLGAAHSISLNLGTIDGLEAPAGAIRSIIGQGVGGLVHGQVGRIAGLEVGGLALKDVVATFPDREHQNPGGMDSGNGNLGTGLLRHFNVAFDYAHDRMLLASNKGYDTPFEWDMSGLWLQPDAHAALRVANVVEKSAAAKAGLAVGDLLTRVNGREVSASDLPALHETLRQADQVVKVTATRDGKPFDVTLKLKRLV